MTATAPALVLKPDLPSPTPVEGITAASGGGYHSLARSSDGLLYSWGSNGMGELGIALNDTTDRWLATLVPDIDPTPIDQGNVIRAVKTANQTDVQLYWSGAPAFYWNLYRDTTKLTLGNTPLLPLLSTTPQRLDLNAVTDLDPYYYQVKGVSGICHTVGE